MATHFIDYQQLVMEAYERKKLNNTLPHGLMHISPAKLKDECLKRCTIDVNRRDESVIRDFCGDLNESRNCHTMIQRCERDKFKPLVNYLKGISESTDEKNIELLAWLIDFSDRPWEMGKVISDNPSLNADGPVIGEHVAASDSQAAPPATGIYKSADNPVIPGNPVSPTWIDGSEENESEPVKTAENSTPPKRNGKFTKPLAAAIMLSLILGTGSMWWWNDRNPPLVSGSCMYWHEDHYEPIACNLKIPNARVIALDTMKLKNFRKITRPDTITYQAIGRVWYSKIDGKIEYFTSGGEHPVVFDRQLKPISVHIIKVHILPGMIRN